jgi:hypothetical protein
VGRSRAATGVKREEYRNGGEWPDRKGKGRFGVSLDL